ncbi:hypothetical protein F5Y18DRAFT_33606 [Xylariaceae sp. FL1019]|nr:hypothetical protein F5Y18DRAFT_33606 [Xylariaceae sp. FL1019]
MALQNADLAVASSLVVLIVIVIYVHEAPVYLAIGSLSATTSKLLIGSLTAGATIFTAVVSSQIRAGLIRSLEDRFHDLADSPHLVQDPDIPTDDHHQDFMRKLDRRWRSILRLETIIEALKDYRIFILYILIGLCTTSIVTAFTPTMSTRTIPFNSRIPDTGFGTYSALPNRSVYGICETNCPESGYDTYQWNFVNKTWAYVAIDGESPATYMPQVINGINTVNIDDHVYADSGVAVERSAMGAPIQVFSGDAFGNVSSKYGQSLSSLTQCVPVMVSNPVHCEKSGHIDILGDSTLRFITGNVTTKSNPALHNKTTDSEQRIKYWNVAGYSVERTVARNFSRDSAMANEVWSYNKLKDNTDNIGITVLGFGAVNDPDGKIPFSSYLSGAMNDPDKSTGMGGRDTYAVTCVVDPRSAFEYRRVTLNLQALGEGKASNYAQYLSGGEACTPLVPTISSKMFAVAGTAGHLLVLENVGIDGNTASLTRLSGNHRGPPYAFPDSTNALEDVLGLVSALAVSRTPMNGDGVPAAEIHEENGLVNASAIIQVIRLGSESNGTYWLLIPLFVSLLTLIALSIAGFQREWTPRGTWVSDTGGRRSKRYTGESIYQLIMLGMAASKNMGYRKTITDDSDAFSFLSPGSLRSSLIDQGARFESSHEE